jgi:hypothetical protein
LWGAGCSLHSLYRHVLRSEGYRGVFEAGENVSYLCEFEATELRFVVNSLPNIGEFDISVSDVQCVQVFQGLVCVLQHTICINLRETLAPFRVANVEHITPAAVLINKEVIIIDLPAPIKLEDILPVFDHLLYLLLVLN